MIERDKHIAQFAGIQCIMHVANPSSLYMNIIYGMKIHLDISSMTVVVQCGPNIAWQIQTFLRLLCGEV